MSDYSADFDYTYESDIPDMSDGSVGEGDFDYISDTFSNADEGDEG